MLSDHYFFYYFNCSTTIVCISANIFFHIIEELDEVQLIILTKQLAFQIHKLAGEREESYCVQTKTYVIFLVFYFTTARADFIFLLNTNKTDSPLLYGLYTFPCSTLVLGLRTSSFFFFLIVVVNAMFIYFYCASWTAGKKTNRRK